MGGCTGSTAGGIKMFRLFVLLEALKAQIRRQMFPNGVFGLHYNRQPIAPAIVTAVVTYAFAYLLTFSLLALGPVADRPDLRGEPGRLGDLAGRRRAWASGRGSAPAARSPASPMPPNGCSSSACWPAGWRSCC